MRKFVLVTMSILACREPADLSCAQLDATFYTNDDCDVTWSSCTDDVLREVRCEFADPRYSCICYLNGEADEAVQLSDDICETVDGEDRAAVRAATNALCGFDLAPAGTLSD
jgi:hypothetical protein